MNILNKKSYNKLKIFLVFFFVMYFLFDAIQVSAHSAYYLKLTYDEGAYTFQSEIVTDSEGLTDTPHIESSDNGGDFLDYIKKNIGKSGTPWTTPILNVTKDNYDIKTYLKDENSMGVGKGNEKSLYYTFPPIHLSSGSWFFGAGKEDAEDFGDDVGDASSKDMDLAYRINDNVVQHFNILSENIIASQGYRPDGRKYLMFMTHLANEAWKVSVGEQESATLTYDLSKLSSDGEGTTTIKIEHVDKTDEKFKKVKNPEIPHWAYLKITLSGINAKAKEPIYTEKQINDEDNVDYYVAFLDKGYCQPGANENYNVSIIGEYKPQQARSKDYRTSCSIGERTKGDSWSVTDARDFEWFGWKSIVLQADYLLSKNISASNSQVLGDEDSPLHDISKVLTSVYTTILNILGLDSMEQIMLNRGKIGNRTYMGLFPKAWVPVVNFVNVILQLIVWSLLAFSLTRLLFKRSLATMNIGEKINLMDGLKNVLTSAILMGIWPLLFTMLGRMNYFIVNMLGAISPYSDTFSMSIIGVNLISLFTAFYVLGITIFFNLSYIIRGITIAFLYALSPVFIYTISLGGKSSSYFNIFLKEMIGHIYIQSFHALMIAFFSYLTKAGAGNATGALGFNHYLVKWVLIFSFIPISNFIKNNILQMGDGVMSSMAQSLHQNLTRKKGYGKEEAKNEIGKALTGGVSGPGGAGGAGGALANRAMQSVSRVKNGKINAFNQSQQRGLTNNEKVDEGSPFRGSAGKMKNSAGTLGGIATGLGNALEKKENQGFRNALRTPLQGVKSKLDDTGNNLSAMASSSNGSLGKGIAYGIGSGLKGYAKFAKNMALANMASGVWGDEQAATEYARKAGREQVYAGMDAKGGFWSGVSGRENMNVSKFNSYTKDSNSSSVQSLNDFITDEGISKENGYNTYSIKNEKSSQNLEKAREIVNNVNGLYSDKDVSAAEMCLNAHDVQQFAQQHPEQAQKMFNVSVDSGNPHKVIDGGGVFNDSESLRNAANSIREIRHENSAANNQKKDN